MTSAASAAGTEADTESDGRAETDVDTSGSLTGASAGTTSGSERTAGNAATPIATATTIEITATCAPVRWIREAGSPTRRREACRPGTGTMGASPDSGSSSAYNPRTCVCRCAAGGSPRTAASSALSVAGRRETASACSSLVVLRG
ncbi:hypothetical protein [Nocardioides sp. B-3]|uniref:hypothetical protein n=1 Tax=Nocardioides sp. B-3 TaxID=2895565 RepID=UPI0021526B3C|nr:hypothetical protein [Nocardioides sp. B-3]UUZ58484.1 hypothetical protein LP418_20240 [Nocardioides sp. B-3]